MIEETELKTKKEVKAVLKNIEDILLTYCVFIMIFISLLFLAKLPKVSLPLLILAIAFKTIPMVSKKRK